MYFPYLLLFKISTIILEKLKEDRYIDKFKKIISKTEAHLAGYVNHT